MYDNHKLVCQVTAAAGTDEWQVKGMDRYAVPFVQAILQKTQEDLAISHVSSSQAESFRIDHDVNIKAATPHGRVRATYDLMRCKLVSDAIVSIPVGLLQRRQIKLNATMRLACTDTFGEPKSNQVRPIYPGWLHACNIVLTFSTLT